MIQQHAHVTESATRAQPAEQARADMARIAARLAARVDHGHIVDNKTLGQPFTNTSKGDSDFAKWDSTVRIFMGAMLGPEILDGMSWGKKQ